MAPHHQLQFSDHTNTDKNAVIWGLLAAAEDLVYVSVESIGLSFLVRFLTYYCHFMFQIRIPYYNCIIIFTYFEFPDLATATTDQQTSRASGQGREGRKKFWWDFSNFLWQVISRFISFRKINSKKYSFNMTNILWIIFHSLNTQSTVHNKHITLTSTPHTTQHYNRRVFTTYNVSFKMFYVCIICIIYYVNVTQQKLEPRLYKYLV